MKFFVYLFLFTTFLAACELPKTTNQTNGVTDNRSKSDTIRYETMVVNENLGDCDGGRCATVEFTYLKFNDTYPFSAKVNETLAAAIRGNAPTVAAAVDSFLAEAQEFFDQVPDGATGYATEAKQRLINTSEPYLVVEEAAYYYTGGAHGNYGIGFYNFDQRTGQLLTLDDLFRPEYQATLEEVTEQYFKKKFLKAGMTNYSEAGFYFDDDQFTMTDNFAILPDSLLFVYNPYEIAPYAMGMSEVTVPKSALKSILK